MLRRIPAVVAVLGLSALALVGCAASPADAACERPTTGAPVLDLIDVSGSAGAPAAVLSAPVFTDETVFADLAVGDGPRVTTRAQDVQFTATILNGATGETLVSAPTDVTSVESWGDYYQGISVMLECATEGSRIVAALAPEAIATEAATQLGLGADQSAVVVIDLQRVFLPAADGTPQYNDRRGMPSVVLAPDGRPGIIVPDAEPPAELAVQVLKKGDGEPVTDEVSARIHYTGVTWADRKVFDSTWEKGASASVTLDGVVPGFAQALEGQTVGSQLLVVIPPELGYGDEGTGTIPGGATLVFVIDILGVEAATAE